VSPDRHARAERLGDWFELQLRFATHMAGRLALPLADGVLRYTNFHRRFGLGDPDAALAPQWADYAQGLRQRPDLPAQRIWTQDFFVAAPPETRSPQQRYSGSFSCEAPDRQGVVRIHFVNRDEDEASPLARHKVGRRRAELSALFAYLADRHPEAKCVRGISWLYHLEAYRRLFPPDYGASARPATWARLSGTSSWGQFLRHDERLRPEAREVFLANLAGLDPAAPWRSFPLPVLTAQAPIAVFHAFYAAPASHNVDELPAQL
jgi:hypothetical protein